MKRLFILFTLLLSACGSAEKPSSEVLAAAREQLTQGNQCAALTLLLEAESSSRKNRFGGEIACEIGRLYRQQGRPDLARSYYLKAFTAGFIDLDAFVAETSIRTADSLLIPLSETEYVFRRNRFAVERAHLQKTLRITIGGGVALLVLVGLGYFRLRRRRNRETETLLALIDSLNHSAASLLTELDDRRSSETRLKELLANRFSEIRELTDTIYQYEHNPVLLHRKLREVLSLRTTDSALFEDLEEVVDAYRNGLIRRLRQQYSSLTQNELQFCALLAAGFSAQEICILLSIQSVQNVWMKKYRLRCKLGLPPGADVDAFLHDFAQVEPQESATTEKHIENQANGIHRQS